jgi:hypothetical protein
MVEGMNHPKEKWKVDWIFKCSMDFASERAPASLGNSYGTSSCKLGWIEGDSIYNLG